MLFLIIFRKIMQKTKTCLKCKKKYPATTEYFYKNKNALDGLFVWCKICKQKSDKNYHIKHKEEIAKQRFLYRKNNKEKIREMDIKYRAKLKNRKPEEILVPKRSKCRRCGKLKLAKEFYRHSTRKNGLTIFCRECFKFIRRESYLKHREKRLIERKRYAKQNKAKIAAAKKLYYLSHRDAIRSYKKLWRQKNAIRLREGARQYRQSHRAQRRLYEINRLKTDLNYRLQYNLRSRLHCALRLQNSKKSDLTMKLIGCSINELKRYLQSKFLRGMTWNNYGKNGWCIDHIVPCAFFDLSKAENQKKCFHYSNLQPMWAIDNMYKNSLYNGIYIRKKYIRRKCHG